MQFITIVLFVYHQCCRRLIAQLLNVYPDDDYQPPYWLMSAIDDEQEKVTLENYLVPFDIKWAKRFLEGMPTDEESSPDNQKAVKEVKLKI